MTKTLKFLKVAIQKVNIVNFKIVQLFLREFFFSFTLYHHLNIMWYDLTLFKKSFSSTEKLNFAKGSKACLK